MSLRTWMLAKLEPLLGSSEVDPDAFVELTTVPPFEVPLIEQALLARGVACQTTQTFNAATALESSRIAVKQSDLATGYEALSELRSS